MDNEGYEYELISELIELEHRISGLVIEFHDTFARRDVFLKSMEQLSSKYFVTHTHVNNFGGISPDGQPVVYEVSFVNKRLISEPRFSSLQRKSLVALDQPNNQNSPEIELAFE